MSSGDYDNDKDAAIKKRLLSDASDVLTEEQEAAKAAADKSRALVWSFIAMVVVGLGNKIFQPLQMVPMYVLAPLPCVAACAPAGHTWWHCVTQVQLPTVRQPADHVRVHPHELFVHLPHDPPRLADHRGGTGCAQVQVLHHGLPG